jgi:hypothetical protein
VIRGGKVCEVLLFRKLRLLLKEIAAIDLEIIDHGG